MLDWIADRVRGFMTKTPAGEISANLERARAELSRAEGVHRTSRAEYVDALTRNEEGAEIARLRKRVTTAADAIVAAQERVAALDELLAKARERDAAKEMAQRVRNSHIAGDRLVFTAEALDRSIQDLCDGVVALADEGLEFRGSLPVRPPGGEEYTLAYMPDVLMRRIELRLYGVSGGKFSARGAWSSPYEIANGPTIAAHMRETVQRSLSFQPKVDVEVTAAQEVET
jgi:hypothetical protein